MTLTPEQLVSLTKPRLTKYIAHKPTSKQRAFLCLRNLDAFYGGAAGGGKVLANDGAILTPFGFKKGEELKVGDLINNPDGSVCKVVQLHPEQEYEKWVVSFHDGTETTVTEGHLWLAWRGGQSRKIKNERVNGQRSAEIVETSKIKDWFDKAIKQEKEGRRPNWPLIPVCEEQPFNISHRYPSGLDPYLVGVLLGDGYLSNKKINITSGDYDHMNGFLSDGGYDYNFYKPGKEYDFNKESFLFIRRELTKLGLINKKSYDKFIPRQFKYASVDSRYALIQGLMDTDGTCDTRGQLYYCTVSKQLADDFCFVARSLGATVTVFEKEPFYRNEYGERVYTRLGYNIYIKHRSPKRLFRLKRKKDRVELGEPDLMYKRVSGVEIGGKFKGRCITVSHPNGLYITDDFIVTHNSDALLMAALQYVDIPGYHALLFRDTFSNLIKPEGLLSRAHEWLQPTDAKWADKAYKFPSGATLSFSYLDGPLDHFNHQSAEYQFVGGDEIVNVRENQDRYLFSRLRKNTREKYVSDLVLLHGYKKEVAEDAFLAYEAIPLRHRCAANPPTPEQLAVGAWVKRTYVDDKTREPDVAFIPAGLSDNPYINREEYIKALDKLDPVTRAQLLDGDWEVNVKGRMFDRDWFLVVDQGPVDAYRVRFWDLAATEPSKVNRDPDWTAGVKIAVTTTGLYFIEDVQHFRKTPLETKRHIKRTAKQDGRAVDIFIEQEPGSSGKIVIDDYVRLLAGNTVHGVPSSGSKRQRAMPFASQAEEGNIYIVASEFNKLYLDELEVFPDGVHDDQVDASSGAFDKITEQGTARLRWA